MATPSEPKTPRPQGFRTAQVSFICLVALLLGGALGYFAFGKSSASPTATTAPPTANSTNPPATYSGVHPALTVEQMKQMADVQTSALVEKSKAEPKNASLLTQIASIYQGVHQFQKAADYYQQALNIDAKNANVRTQMASCLFYSGQVDEALHQLQLALESDPRNVNALFNLGMIKYKGKNDATGAIAAWQQLLKDNPNLERKPIVEKMIAEAQAAGAAGK
jgi:cytochrome c-type biogenesis protein CcmH/NrfG